ncbi:MAG: hypothetical protein DRQ37_03945 [Gammaproteobacteria bacterium]|nr:MAG: hypothetical protein DRQ37_03945 [Gammaproteobacteria bacterium]
MLKVGDAAPDFSLPSAGMHLRSLGDYGTALLVLYFYPRDDTPGCTLQATDFTEMINQFAAAGAQVVGVSQDGRSHACRRFGIEYGTANCCLGQP